MKTAPAPLGTRRFSWKSCPRLFLGLPFLSSATTSGALFGVRVWKSGLPEERAESLNLSRLGIFFASRSRIAEGEVVGVLLKMPEEITGQPTTEWRCTGQVVRVEAADSLKGKFGVGVQFCCYVIPD